MAEQRETEQAEIKAENVTNETAKTATDTTAVHYSREENVPQTKTTKTTAVSCSARHSSLLKPFSLFSRSRSFPRRSLRTRAFSYPIGVGPNEGEREREKELRERKAKRETSSHARRYRGRLSLSFFSPLSGSTATAQVQVIFYPSVFSSVPVVVADCRRTPLPHAFAVACSGPN